MPTKKRRVNVIIEDPMYTQLGKSAKRVGKSIPEVIRILIQKTMEPLTPEPPKKKTITSEDVPFEF